MTDVGWFREPCARAAQATSGSRTRRLTSASQLAQRKTKPLFTEVDDPAAMLAPD
jgi:hypothetical protein